MKRSICLILLCLITPFSGYASVIDTQDKILNQVERNLPNFNEGIKHNFTVLNEKVPPNNIHQEENGQTFFFKNIVIDKITPEFSFLQNIANKHSDKNYSSKDIDLLLKNLNEALITRGYVTSRVFVEPQNLHTGILKLSLLAGKIENIKFDETVKNYGNVLSFKKGDILNIRSIEQTIDNFNSVLNQKATVKLMPSNKIGHTVVIFHLENKARFEINTSMDNFGNEVTGKTQGNISISIAKPLNINDSFYYSITKTFPFEAKKGSNLQYIYYHIPLNRDSIAFSYSYSDYEQEISYAIHPFKSSGNFTTKEFIWTHLLHRNSKTKTELINKIIHKTRHSFINENEIDVQKRRTTAWEIGVHQTHYINNGLMDWYLGYSKGINLWAELGPMDNLGEATTRHNIYLAKLNLLKQFPVNKRKCSYKFEFKGQYTTSNLYASEFFSIGGWNAVRGFSGDINLSAENGFYIRNTIEIPTSNINNVYLGIDYGKVSGQYSSELLGTELVGAAIGIKGRYKNMTYNIFGAYPIKKPKGFKVPQRLLGLQFNFKW